MGYLNFLPTILGKVFKLNMINKQGYFVHLALKRQGCFMRFIIANAGTRKPTNISRSN